jgi:hypothetical protein
MVACASMRNAGPALLCCVTACTGYRDNPTTPTDAPGDSGPCGGAEQLVTGELVDFDSTTAQFQGVFNARFTLEGMPAKTATTAPNGRFELCAPATKRMTFDVDAPADYLDGKAYIEAEALSHQTVSFRAYSQLRGSKLYSFDASRGHVLVFLAGDRSDLTLSRQHAPPLSGNDDDDDGVFTWTPGNAGRYVLFPNVDVSSPTITLDGDTSGPHTIPVIAGKLTLVAISFFFL